MVAQVDAAGVEGWAELVARGRDLVAQQDAIQWQLGDLAAEVETVYGEGSLEAFAAEIEQNAYTLRDLRRVARAFEKGERSPNLSWTHHRIAASIEDPARARELLQRAEREGWSTRRLDAERLAPEPGTDAGDGRADDADVHHGGERDERPADAELEAEVAALRPELEAALGGGFLEILDELPAAYRREPGHLRELISAPAAERAALGSAWIDQAERWQLFPMTPRLAVEARPFWPPPPAPPVLDLRVTAEERASAQLLQRIERRLREAGAVLLLVDERSLAQLVEADRLVAEERIGDVMARLDVLLGTATRGGPLDD